MKRYITKARKAGVSAIVLTVDALVGCSMCKSSPSNLPKVEFPIQELPLFPKDPAIPFSNLDDYYAKYMGSGASWNDIRQIIEFAELPVILKGILHPEDAKMAAEVGAKGIIISNHGGRQLDGAISTIDALRKVPAEVRQKLDVYMDGGIRQGSDVFKAIALGAKAVLVGRPVLYGLAADGENGVSGVLQILTNELRQCMHTMGCAKISDITADRINTTI
jgi:isopentenyl diphosphate isomerase/L-lactate dehydrogenase-like FMN-dependent dehydrogenase